MTVIKKSMITAVCLALCVILPQVFHAVPNAGNIYCPIHIPVLLCGLVCGYKYGLLCGVAGPVFSMLFTGMPMVAHLPGMMVECGVYGCISGMPIFKNIHNKEKLLLYIRLVISMIAGRMVAGVVNALIFMPGQYTFNMWVVGYFLTGFPGIVLHLIIIPAIVFALEKSAVIQLDT